MMKIYKEGQGKWARGLMAFVVMIGSVFALTQLHDTMPKMKDPLTLPVLGWQMDYRFLIEAPLLIAAAVFSYWLFNRPATADFLIDTESELKNKVTWPSQKEEVNASIVVVITVFLLSVFIFSVDKLFQLVNKLVY